MREREKNRILKLHLQEQKGVGGGGRGGTNTSSSGQYDGNAFEAEGPLSVSGREKDLGSLPDEVDITKGSKGFDFTPKIAFITGPGDDDDDDDDDIGDDDIDIDIEDVIDFIDIIKPKPKPPKEPIEDIIPITMPGPGPITSPIVTPPAVPVSPSQPDDNEEINKPLSLSCCKKCDNGMYTNRCFPFDSDEDEDCRFPTLKICEDESEPRLPSMLDIFA